MAFVVELVKQFVMRLEKGCIDFYNSFSLNISENR